MLKPREFHQPSVTKLMLNVSPSMDTATTRSSIEINVL